MRTACLLVLAIILAGCRNDEQTGSVNASCVEKLYPSYNPRSFEQCVNVCNKCEAGTVATCTTSCRLRGAQ